MLKIGIVGCGKIAQVRHAPEYSENPDCQITGFYDFVPENAQKLAAEYGAKAYDSLEALLSSGVDAVSICSANVAHASAAIAALRDGDQAVAEMRESYNQRRRWRPPRWRPFQRRCRRWPPRPP